MREREKGREERERQVTPFILYFAKICALGILVHTSHLNLEMRDKRKKDRIGITLSKSKLPQRTKCATRGGDKPLLLLCRNMRTRYLDLYSAP